MRGFEVTKIFVFYFSTWLYLKRTTTTLNFLYRKEGEREGGRERGREENRETLLFPWPQVIFPGTAVQGTVLSGGFL